MAPAIMRYTGVCKRCGRERPIFLTSRLCKSCSASVRKGHNLRGSPEHVAKIKAADAAAPPVMYGAANPAWKGGYTSHAMGYRMVQPALDDGIGNAMRTGKQYVLEHRLVMAHHLGRPLASSEPVHHINGIKDDNRIENLALMRSRSEHVKAIHLALCPHCGKSLREAA